MGLLPIEPIVLVVVIINSMEGIGIGGPDCFAVGAGVENNIAIVLHSQVSVTATLPICTRAPETMTLVIFVTMGWSTNLAPFEIVYIVQDEG